MASLGHHVTHIGDNANLKWKITGAPGKAVIAFSYIFVGVYGLTWAPTGWVHCSEVFPLKYRAKGVGLSASVNWLFNFALAYFVAPAFTNIQWRTYIIFAVFCAAMTVHIFFTYPETAGRTLEEIDHIFDANLPAWKRSSKAPARFQDDLEAAAAAREKGFLSAASVDDKAKTERESVDRVEES